jgi:hypothetical protein
MLDVLEPPEQQVAVSATRPSINLSLEGWDKDEPEVRAYLREARMATCLACGHVVKLETLTVEGNAWRFCGVAEERVEAGPGSVADGVACRARPATLSARRQNVDSQARSPRKKPLFANFWVQVSAGSRRKSAAVRLYSSWVFVAKREEKAGRRRRGP